MRVLGLLELLPAVVSADNSPFIAYYSDRAIVSLTYGGILRNTGVCNGLLK